MECLRQHRKGGRHTAAFHGYQMNQNRPLQARSAALCCAAGRAPFSAKARVFQRTMSPALRSLGKLLALAIGCGLLGSCSNS